MTMSFVQGKGCISVNRCHGEFALRHVQNVANQSSSSSITYALLIDFSAADWLKLVYVGVGWHFEMVSNDKHT